MRITTSALVLETRDKNFLHSFQELDLDQFLMHSILILLKKQKFVKSINARLNLSDSKLERNVKDRCKMYNASR